MTEKFRRFTTAELSVNSANNKAGGQHHPIVFVLDSIRSLNNVGSVFRTADSFGMEGLILCGVTGQPPHRDIQKTALGATETVRWTYCESVATCLDELKQNNYILVGVEQVENSIGLEVFPFSKAQKLAFILGNEVSGVSNEALSLCDYVVELPQFGSKHSLNVAVAAGIVGWAAIQPYLV